MREREPGPAPTMANRVSTGVPGLDDILGGGLTASRLYLLEGTPGTGKTTLALQFLRAGRRAASVPSTSRCPKPPRNSLPPPRPMAGTLTASRSTNSRTSWA